MVLENIEFFFFGVCVGVYGYFFEFCLVDFMIILIFVVFFI